MIISLMTCVYLTVLIILMYLKYVYLLKIFVICLDGINIKLSFYLKKICLVKFSPLSNHGGGGGMEMLHLRTSLGRRR